MTVEKELPMYYEDKDIPLPVRPSHRRYSLCLKISVAVVCVICPLAIGFMSVLGLGDFKQLEWFQHVKQAPWTPPHWVFGMAWMILYPLMGFASFLLWLNHVNRGVAITVPGLVYVLQLLLNGLWMPLVYGQGWFKAAFLDTLLLFLAVVACVALFRRISSVASMMMVPQALFVVFSVSLTTYLALNNPDGKPDARSNFMHM